MNKNIQNPPGKNGEAKELDFQGLKGKKVSIVFDEPELTSDAGLLAIDLTPENWAIANEILAG